MAHKISVSDAAVYEFSHQIAASFGRSEHKTLTAIVRNGSVRYEVWSHKELVESTANLTRAVDAYNEA